MAEDRLTDEQLDCQEWARTCTARHSPFLRKMHHLVNAGDTLTPAQANAVGRIRYQEYGVRSNRLVSGRCKNGKVLAGSWMCACHGISREKIYEDGLTGAG